MADDLRGCDGAGLSRGRIDFLSLMVVPFIWLHLLPRAARARGAVLRGRAGRRLAIFVFIYAGGAIGCVPDQTIHVDLTAEPVRFIIDHSGWPAPFRYPRVTEFAIASEEDGAVWEIETVAPGGVPARDLAVIYGHVPEGFAQNRPPHASPPPLVRGRTYFVAAGGSESVYRMVFALPAYRPRPGVDFEQAPSPEVQMDISRPQRPTQSGMDEE